MSKRKAINASQQAREKILFRYSSALERGDFETVETLLEEAAQDPALDKMMAEIDAAFEAELSAAQTILSAQGRHREDHKMVSSVIGATPLPKAPSRVYRPSGVLALVAVLVTVLAGGLFMFAQGNRNPSTGSVLLLQNESATATIIPSLVPTSTPLPATSFQLMMASPPPVVGCDTPQATISVPVNGQVMTDPTVVMGVADTPNFGYYRIELLGPATTGLSISFGDQSQAVSQEGSLGQIFPPAMEPGQYQVRLSVFDNTGTLQANCSVNIIMASYSVLPAGVDVVQQPGTPCTTSGMTVQDVTARVRSSAKATQSGIIPAGITFDILAGGLPAPDDTSESPQWAFVKADVNGNSVQGWINLRESVVMTCPPVVADAGQPVSSTAQFAFPTPTPVPAGLEPVLASPTLIPPDVSQPAVVPAVPTVPPPVVTIEGVQCQAIILVPDGIDVYSRPALDAVNLGHIPSSVTLNILDQTFGPFNDSNDVQIVWYYVSVFVEGRPVQGWVSAEFTGATGDPCQMPNIANPQNSISPDNAILFTATAIIQQATETAAVQQGIVLPTFESGGVQVVTATPFTASSNPQIVSVQGDPILLTATAIVQLATETAVAGMLPTFTPTPAPADSTGFLVVPTLDATPVSLYLTYADVENVQVITTVPLGTLPVNAPVKIISGYYDGSRWIYQIESTDGQQLNADDSQLTFYFQTVARPTEDLCVAINPSNQAITVHTEPNPDSPQVGVFSSRGGASVTLMAVQAGTNQQNWYLVDGGGYVGWIPENSATLIGNACGAMTNFTTAVSAFTPTPVAFAVSGSTFTPTPFTAAGGVADGLTLCQVFNGGTDDVRVRSLPSSGNDSVLLGSLPGRMVADVIQQERNPQDGFIWYFINIQIDRARLEGWVRSDNVTALTDCPPLQ